MIHAAAQGEPYACFVREDARIPFMAMPDAARALVQSGAAPRAQLNHAVYNVTSFSLSAARFVTGSSRPFPMPRSAFAPDAKRAAIIDSWPADLDDSAARRDWGWQPQYDGERAFQEYLIPNIRKRYQGAEGIRDRESGRPDTPNP